MDSAAKLRNRDSGGKVTTVMGSDAGAGGLGANMTWKELDERVNEYPSDRKFQAIGRAATRSSRRWWVSSRARSGGQTGGPGAGHQLTEQEGRTPARAARWKTEKRWSPSAALKACEKVVWYL